jgi:tol-pal system protein YbgF
MPQRRLRTLAVGLSLIALAASAGVAQAQNSGADRRFDRMERDLRTLQSIVMQAQATGQPVVVKPEGPDPAVTALQARVDDLEQTLQRINGQVETVTHELDQAKRADAAAEAERRAQADLLNERLARIEAQLVNLGQAAVAADPSLAEVEPPPAPSGDASSDATARAQAENRGVLGGPPAAPPPPPPAARPAPPATPTEAFNAARALFNRGEHAAAADAFQDFVSRYPTNARAPEAYYWLGESFYAQKGFQNATAAYAAALRNRPTTSWAPAAMVRLSQALLQGGQNTQACAALSEFDQRYASRASAALKTNADAVRRRARCS